MDKFFEIYRDTKIYYDINSPLIIEVQALYKTILKTGCWYK